MLRELSVRDFVIVKTACLRLERGFHVLTGETGAGKSILIDALSLVLGARATSDVVRPGAERADIHAIIEPTATVMQWLKANDLDQNDDELILRRVIDQHGKSRAYINGAPVTVTQLREIGEQVVDIHGQHAHQSLMRAEAQRDLLDEHLQLSDQRAAIRNQWNAWQTIRQKLEQATQGAAKIAEQLEVLSWQVKELEQLAPKAGEWQQVSEEHARLSNGQALIDASATALAAIDDDEAGAQRTLARAIDQIRHAARHDARLTDILQSLESADIALSQARSDLNHYVDDLELDPQRLAELDQRMQALFSAARKYRCEPEQLPETFDQIKAKLHSMTADQDLAALQAQASAAQAQYETHAQVLHQARIKGAKTLAKTVTQKMQSLGMPGGRFVIEIEPSTPSAHGSDRVTFLVSGHEGVAPSSLSKVASGGELSRISLALSVVASQATHIPTLVFDEVDSGVSGAVAEMVGRLLNQLGANHQVLCVTHLPQVAACAQHHFRVAKLKTKADGVTSSIDLLDDSGRIEAIAELLGGVDITDTTRSHAKELLASTRA
ncbi:DNA repair protein RecN [Orrella daihaiensis]|uniref:DNA repair protein RecN n=1 Tax=Orrella daihaiensis TaxID=2782176 RepID=A0ABY4AM54_9BURK|nr:DNA repair protein RecN [Orrella daihaiensis]UOD51358.1 DNA repair protein RecN [Orrella daihaiensis]